MIKDMSFGALFRELRLKNKITMRQYCLKNGFDSGNISKLERNLIAPPYTLRQLKQYLAPLKYDSLEFDFLLTAAQNYHIASVNRRFQIDHRTKKRSAQERSDRNKTGWGHK